MKSFWKYFCFIIITLLLVGCTKGPGKVRLKPSSIRVSAEETEVNVSCITGGYIKDIFTCGSDFQDKRGSDPTYRIIKIEEMKGAQINPVEAENEWIHISMHSLTDVTVRIKENKTGVKRYGMVVFVSSGHDTIGFLKITQDAR